LPAKCCLYCGCPDTDLVLTNTFLAMCQKTVIITVIQDQILRHHGHIISIIFHIDLEVCHKRNFKQNLKNHNKNGQKTITYRTLHSNLSLNTQVLCVVILMNIYFSPCYTICISLCCDKLLFPDRYTEQGFELIT
jgi:hypothetical protein